MKLNRQTVFTLVVGIMMVTWVVGTALSFNIQTAGNGMRIDPVYDRLLTPQEKITILRSGQVLIEYLYIESDESSRKKTEYENLVQHFKDFVVLEVVEISQTNQTKDEMIVPTGDVIPLENITGEKLIDTFCEKSVVQPRECLLRSI